MAYTIRRGADSYNPPKPVYTPPPAAAATQGMQDQYGTFGAAVQQQAGDYGNIMQGYKDIMAKMNTGAQVTPQTAAYQPSQANTSAVANLSNLATTGGYSPADVANIRERGLAPIRSIYSSANRDVDRQRGLQGGYSPNYAAVKAKMARELSESLAGQTTNVNAQLAEQIAGGRRQSATGYASAAGAENAMQNQFNQQNADTINEANRFNATNLPGQSMQALNGMQSLYGTTPALASTFGNQALQGATLQNQINQQGQQGYLQAIGNAVSGARGGVRKQTYA